ncbi:MAG: 1-deoxy-D-xylulose-5-phosphate reductoisomerase [Candidatus Omnitrophica bacterium]|nr:1-deoxy-D-xylulose-5-phosphate reductoisomerase [Candidatus Omnitrophota bacterium]
MKRIAILGSTGSIGKSTLDVIRAHPEEFRVAALTANSDTGTLMRQIKEFKPRFVCINDKSLALKLKIVAGNKTKVLSGEDGLSEIAGEGSIDLVLLAVSGIAALGPLLNAIEHGKSVACANKEALVAAGEIIMRRAKKNNVSIIPVDSEQSAIWQCLLNNDSSKIKNIYLTASGGPFRKASLKDLRNATLEQVLKHPRWKMGKKITVDSATLMNKGLEFIEAMFLFNLRPQEIKILVHPEAFIHSMVEFIDGVVMAQLSETDMRIPIQYALSYPLRLSGSHLPHLDFYKLKELHFEKPDVKKFPCLGLAYRAAVELGTMPAVLNAANEVCVERFLERSLRFGSIPLVIEKVMDRHKNGKNPDLETIKQADSWARVEAQKIIEDKQ